MNLGEFLVATLRMERTTLSAVTDHRKRITSAPMEVQKAVDHLYEALLDIILQNSTLMRLALRRPKLGDAVVMYCASAPEPVQERIELTQKARMYSTVKKWLTDPHLRYAA